MQGQSTGNKTAAGSVMLCMSMGPKEIAAYCDSLWDEFRKTQWSGDYAVEFIKIALRERLEFERTRAYGAGLRDR